MTGRAMHNDEPTLLDALERGALIREVGEAVATCTPPQVFGVHGDWGLGKTSLLHQVQWYLMGTCPQQSDDARKEASSRELTNGTYDKTTRAIWFDAWRYQYEDVPVVALLQEMRAQLSTLRRTSNAAKAAARGALYSFENVTKKIGFQYSKFQQASREWNAENLATPLPSHTMRQHLREAIDQLLPRKKKDCPLPRLVIFIDDIDRCEPTAAYRLLEGLKIYLTLENCVFVLGMNQKVIEEAIGIQIPNDETRMVRAAAYMEKLCQNVWRLPTVRQPHLFLAKLLEETVADEATRRRIIRGVEDHHCLPPNPRRLKGLANLIGRLWVRLPKVPTTLPEEQREKAAIQETQLLMIVAYIYQFHHDLYVRWEVDVNLYKKIYDWCNEGETTLLFLKSLILPYQEADMDREGRTEQRSIESTYPDPAEARVFWIQSLIQSLGKEVSPDRFQHYLYGRDRT